MAPTPDELEGLPREGSTLAGKFLVEKVLGVGGMGVVVAAKHVHLGQKVAIKFLRKDAARSSESVNRFLREARAAVGLQSAHVVRVMDVGVLDDGMPYMVMEHLTGTDLSQVLEQRKRLPAQEAVDYVLQGMEAVAEAHALGIVHRDLKPSNLFLSRAPDGSPLVKVLDFGISKAEGVGGPQEQSLTATSAVMGSPLYMSPEQLRSSKNVDARTDVWALGVILYELLAGQPPFAAETMTGLCAKIAADPATPLRAIDPGLPVPLEAVVMRCLEKDMARRFASVAELATALHPFASVEGRMSAERAARIGGPRGATTGSAGIAVPASAPGASTGYAETQASWQTLGAQLRRRTATVALAAAGAVVALGSVAAVALWPREHREHEEGAHAAAGIAAPPAPSAAALPAASIAPEVEPAAPSASAAPAPVKTAAPVHPARTLPARPVARPASPAPAATATATKPDDLLLDRK